MPKTKTAHNLTSNPLFRDNHVKGQSRNAKALKPISGQTSERTSDVLPREQQQGNLTPIPKCQIPSPPALFLSFTFNLRPSSFN